MRTVRIGSVAAFLVLGVVAACGGGGDSGGTNGGGGGAGGTGATGTGATGTGATGATGTGATGGGPAIDCQTAADCAAQMPATTPAGCADASCDTVLGKCVFKARDDDGDGHAKANCVASGGGVIEVGDDCDDADANTYPGAWDGPADGSNPDRCDTKDQDCDGNADDEQAAGGKSCACDPSNPPKCSDSSQGTAIPGLDSSKDGVGICKLGVRECVNGVAGACNGAVGPAEKNCASEADNDCNGTADKSETSACQCQSGQTQSCQTGQLGACAVGVQQCMFNGRSSAWSPCKSTVTPATNCSSAGDENCNGVPDKSDLACKCQPGNVAVGQDRSCNSHPEDGTGTCQAGTQDCVLNGTIVQWSLCTGDVGPKSQDSCQPFQDNNCDGLYGDAYGSCFVTVYTLVPKGEKDNFLNGLPLVNADAMWSPYDNEAGWDLVFAAKMYKSQQPDTVPAVRCYNSSIGNTRAS